MVSHILNEHTCHSLRGIVKDWYPSKIYDLLPNKLNVCEMSKLKKWSD